MLNNAAKCILNLIALIKYQLPCNGGWEPVATIARNQKPCLTCFHTFLLCLRNLCIFVLSGLVWHTGLTHACQILLHEVACFLLPPFLQCSSLIWQMIVPSKASCYLHCVCFSHFIDTTVGFLSESIRLVVWNSMTQAGSSLMIIERQMLSVWIAVLVSRLKMQSSQSDCPCCACSFSPLLDWSQSFFCLYVFSVLTTSFAFTSFLF